MPAAAALIPAVLAAAGASPIVVSIATVVAGVVSLVASTLLAPKPKLPKPSDGQTNVRQQNGPRWRYYGRVRRGGQMFFFDSANGYLHVGIIFNHGAISAFEEWWLNGEQVTTATDIASPLQLKVTTAQYVSATNKNLVFIRPQDGSANTADATLISKFPSIWTSNHKLEGLAVAVLICRSVEASVYNKIYPQGRPELTAVFKAETSVYDPRDGSTGWSDNAGLVIRDYLTHADGMNLSTSLIDEASFASFADVCDQAVPLAAGGTEARYRIWGGYPLDAEPASVLREFLDCCAAEIYQTREGKLGIRGGVYAPPSVTLGPDQILEADMHRGADALARYNRIRFEYTDPDANYLEQEGEAWTDADLLAANGGVIEEGPLLRVHDVPSHAQGRRLVKIQIAKDNPAWIGEVRTTLAGLDAWTEEFVRLEIPELEIAGPFRVKEIRWAGPGRGVSLSVESVDPAAWEWSTSEEGNAPSVDAPATNTVSVATPTGLFVVARRQEYPTVTVYIAQAVWDEHARDDVTFDLRYREQGTLAWTTASAQAGETTLQTGALQNPGTYEWQIRAVSPNGVASDWSSIVTHAMNGDTTFIPGAALSVTGSSPSAGTLSVSWTNSSSSATEGADVFVGSTSSFSAATRAYTEPGVASDSESVSFDWDAGTWYVWVAEYGHGQQGTATAISGATVTIS